MKPLSEAAQAWMKIPLETPPTYNEITESLADLVFESCTNDLSPESAKRMGLWAYGEVETAAVRLLERLGRVTGVREINGGLRADWAKEASSDSS